MLALMRPLHSLAVACSLFLPMATFAQEMSLAEVQRRLKRANDYATAESLFQRNLQIRERALGQDHPEVADALNHLANLYYDTDFQHFLNTPWNCALNNVRNLNLDREQYAKAEPFYARSLQIREANFGLNHPDVANALHNLAQLYRNLGQYAKAEPLFERSLQIREIRFGKDHPETAAAVNSLAALHHDMGQHERAEQGYLRSLQIYDTRLGPPGLDTALVLNNLANLYRDMNQCAKAEPFYERSLVIREAKLGKDHPAVVRTSNGMAWNFVAQNQWAKAIDQLQIVRQASTRHMATVLPDLSEQQRSSLKASYEWSLHRALSLGWSAPKDAGAASAEWLLNGKAVARQSLTQQQILARGAKNPKAKSWIKLDELQAKLGPTTAFVDFARFDVFDFNNKQHHGTRYVAWITPPPGKGPVQLVDLGEAELIDPLVERTRQPLTDSAEAIVKGGEAEAQQAPQAPLQALSAQVLHPLLTALADYKEWIVCPDGALALAPWQALLLPDGKSTTGKHRIKHIVSGRELVALGASAKR